VDRVSLPILEGRRQSALSFWKITLPLKAILLSSNGNVSGSGNFLLWKWHHKKWKLLAFIMAPSRVLQAVFKKRKGDFSCETSPSLFRFSEIRLRFLITALAIPESFGTHERQPVLLPHSSMITFAARAFPTAVRFRLPGPSLVADSRRPPLVRSLLLEDHSSAETNSTLHQREC
jgi:hypothetical protein